MPLRSDTVDRSKNLRVFQKFKLSAIFWLPRFPEGVSDTGLNPFFPGSGVKPPALVGRQQEFDAFDLLVARAKANAAGDRGILLIGLRGVGKTVLLNEFLEIARRNGWLVFQLEAQAG